MSLPGFCQHYFDKSKLPEELKFANKVEFEESFITHSVPDINAQPGKETKKEKLYNFIALSSLRLMIAMIMFPRVS